METMKWLQEYLENRDDLRTDYIRIIDQFKKKIDFGSSMEMFLKHPNLVISEMFYEMYTDEKTILCVITNTKKDLVPTPHESFDEGYWVEIEPDDTYEE